MVKQMRFITVRFEVDPTLSKEEFDELLCKVIHEGDSLSRDILEGNTVDIDIIGDELSNDPDLE